MICAHYHRHRGTRPGCWLGLCAWLLFTALLSPIASAIELAPGSYFWYAPEHEKYGRTAFYSQPNFQSGQVQVARTQRFRLVGASKGWAMIEFDAAGKAYVHLRILGNIAYDPAASDPWHEFKRASLFEDLPSRVEARLKAPTHATTESVGDTKVPA